MLNRKSFGFDWGQFITGILFLIAAFVVMRYPLATLKTVTFIFLVNSNFGVATITMMFAIWFLVDSVGSLFNVGHLRIAGTGWFVLYLVLDILAVIVSLMLFMQPVVAAITLVTLLSMFFVLFGIECIVLAFARRNI